MATFNKCFAPSFKSDEGFCCETWFTFPIKWQHDLDCFRFGKPTEVGMWDMNDRERMFLCHFRIKITSKYINNDTCRCQYPEIVYTNTYLIKDSYQILLYLSNWFIHTCTCIVINNSENGIHSCK